jgi:uncharacterized repeat protein (TIGR01451 family)
MSRKGKLTLALLGSIMLGAALTAVGQQNRAGAMRDDGPSIIPADGGKKFAKKSAQQVNHVSLEIIGPDGASFGVPADYELVVRNEGANQVENVRVEAELPASCEFVSANPTADVDEGTATWVLDRLTAGQERRIKLQLKPVEEGTIECHAMVTCMAISGVQTTVTRPQIEIVMSGPKEITIGQDAVFTLRVSNPGTGAATNVLVRDLVPPGFEHPAGDEIEYEVGTLPPGEAREVKLELTAKTSGPHKNYAQVTADGGLKQAAESNIRVLEPLLVLKKTGPKKRYLDRPATYQIEVSNPGTAPASKVAVVDELPDGVVLVEASDSGRVSQDKRTVRWALDELEPGERRTLSVTVKPTTPGEFVTQAVATADGGLKAEAEASTIVEGVCSLLVEVIDLNGPIEVGTETTYEIRVVNRGSQAATNLTVQAIAPKGMTPMKAEGPPGVKHEVSGKEVIFEPIPRLAPRADAGFQVRVRGDRPGDMRFTVEVHCDQLDTSLKKEEGTRVYADN